MLSRFLHGVKRNVIKIFYSKRLTATFVRNSLFECGKKIGNIYEGGYKLT